MTTNHNNDDGLVIRNTDWFVREITIKQDFPIERIVTILRESKTTGDLCIYFNQGGIRAIELHERKKATGPQSEQIREILSIVEKTS